MIERQELYCHACGNYVQFNLDLEVNGNYVLKCPSCDHEHCRVVRNGRITDDRWNSRNGPTIQLNQRYVTYTTASVSANTYNYWINTSSSSATTGY